MVYLGMQPESTENRCAGLVTEFMSAVRGRVVSLVICKTSYASDP